MGYQLPRWAPRSEFASLRRALDRFRFEVGKYLLRGAFYRLLIILA